MGKTLSSSPAWVKASWISWKNSGSRDGATAATAWRSAASDRGGIAINGSAPCGHSAAIQLASAYAQHYENRPPPLASAALLAPAASSFASITSVDRRQVRVRLR